MRDDLMSSREKGSPSSYQHATTPARGKIPGCCQRALNVVWGFILFLLIHFLYLSIYRLHPPWQFCAAEHQMNGSADPKDAVIEPDGPSEVFREDEEECKVCSNRRKEAEPRSI